MSRKVTFPNGADGIELAATDGRSLAVIRTAKGHSHVDRAVVRLDLALRRKLQGRTSTSASAASSTFA